MNSTAMDANWKLVRLGAKGPWELYDLAIDPTEGQNLADQQTERVKSLTAAWTEWAGRVGVKASYIDD